MARHEDTLAGVTCWLGHQIDQEQWTHQRRTVDGRTVDHYETRCECGEQIAVYLQDGKIIEEDYDF